MLQPMASHMSGVVIESGAHSRPKGLVQWAALSARGWSDRLKSHPGDGVDMTRYVFITGGVVSSLGKGIASSSLGAILEAHGLRVTLVKLDPYINVDPGTMNPFEHGEVYVTRRRGRDRPRSRAL